MTIKPRWPRCMPLEGGINLPNSCSQEPGTREQIIQIKDGRHSSLQQREKAILTWDGSRIWILQTWSAAFMRKTQNYDHWPSVGNGEKWLSFFSKERPTKFQVPQWRGGTSSYDRLQSKVSCSSGNCNRCLYRTSRRRYSSRTQSYIVWQSLVNGVAWHDNCWKQAAR